ncbi:hypothetical protein H7827_12590 [Streptomyces sp. JH002]|jgi:hypothetical protein|uniref:Uncharacterized protein n=1 Tax=Streptomyces xiamenensis TaxID=408015 RepID=A0A0F7FVC1_9ACTN|nr:MULTISPECIES: hypothetical protein [Streptomyces]AKG44464.1 hypothetical protein SXIM_30800 [Streptomyces xiamenensis]MCU4747505.1 hypothetical protein [Streptomyces sp. G-5]QQN78124.1 hypothetical protein IPZ77_12195 [Streptomyces sp. XC 2026]
MIVSTIIAAALAIVVDEAVEVQFGLPGVIGLLILRTGLRKRNFTCICVGITVLVMLGLNTL